MRQETDPPKDCGFTSDGVRRIASTPRKGSLAASDHRYEAASAPCCADLRRPGCLASAQFRNGLRASRRSARNLTLFNIVDRNISTWLQSRNGRRRFPGFIVRFRKTRRGGELLRLDVVRNRGAHRLRLHCADCRLNLQGAAERSCRVRRISLRARLHPTARHSPRARSCNEWKRSGLAQAEFWRSWSRFARTPPHGPPSRATALTHTPGKLVELSEPSPAPTLVLTSTLPNSTPRGDTKTLSRTRQANACRLLRSTTHGCQGRAPGPLARLNKVLPSAAGESRPPAIYE